MTDVYGIFSALIFPVKPFGSNEFSGAQSISTSARCLEELRA